MNYVDLSGGVNVEEDKCNPATSVSWEFIKEYIDDRFRFCRETRDVILEAKDLALVKAEKSMETRLAGMNEFRDTLKDQAGRFITRNELLGLVTGISTVISIIVALVSMLLKRG
jgi:Flp pilus assembly protein TadB